MYDHFKPLVSAGRKLVLQHPNAIVRTTQFVRGIHAYPGCCYEICHSQSPSIFHMQEGAYGIFLACAPKVALTFAMQVGSPSPDVSTPSSSTVVGTIRLLHGQTIAKELLHVEVSSGRDGGPAPNDEDDEEAEAESWSADAYVTNANYQSKKTVLLLFINRQFIGDPPNSPPVTRTH